MRPHTIQNSHIPNAELDPAERFRGFVRMIVSVPKAEADRELNTATKDSTRKSDPTTGRRKK
jgi:hypothetical protein